MYIYICVYLFIHIYVCVPYTSSGSLEIISQILNVFQQGLCRCIILFSGGLGLVP